MKKKEKQFIESRLPTKMKNKNGLTIWWFNYHWIDDYHWNLGYKELKGSFVGTKEEFQEFWKAEEFGQGFSPWNIKKRHATDKEVQENILEIIPDYPVRR